MLQLLTVVYDNNSVYDQICGDVSLLFPYCIKFKKKTCVFPFFLFVSL